MKRSSSDCFELCTIWNSASSAAGQMTKMVQQCRLTDRIISSDGRISGNAPLATRAGFAAEGIHAETFNLDAILKEKDIKAFTDRYPNSPLSSNNPTNDIVIVKDGDVVQGVQLKYYKDGKTTANAFRDMRDGGAYYKGTDAMVGPAEQLQDIKESARKTELKNQGTRPQVAEAARNVQKKAADRLRQEGVESKPLTKKDAEDIASQSAEGRKKHRDLQNKYKDKSTLMQTGKAVMHAAVTSTVIAGTLNTLNYLDKLQKNEITLDEAVEKILVNTAVSVCDSSLKAGGATAAVSLTARTLPELFTGTLFQQTLSAGAVAGTAVCAIDIIECMVLVAAGKMSPAEFETRTGKNIFQTAAGSWGASIGTVIGAPAGPVGILLGSMIGGMITSLVMSLCIENHIEKPYFELLRTKESLCNARLQLVQCVNSLHEAELYHQYMRNVGEYADRKWKECQEADKSLKEINALLDLGIEV